MLTQHSRNDRRNADARGLTRYSTEPEAGPLWLEKLQFAASVVSTLRSGSTELRHYVLHAFGGDGEPRQRAADAEIEVRGTSPTSREGVTAREGNRVLRRSGKPFWQDASFDHWCGAKSSFTRFVEYVEHNPVTAAWLRGPGLAPAQRDSRSSRIIDSSVCATEIGTAYSVVKELFTLSPGEQVKRALKTAPTHASRIRGGERLGPRTEKVQEANLLAFRAGGRRGRGGVSAY